MNNYIALEIHDLANKLKGYNVLFNYRLSNLCIKAEPTALMPVTVLVADTEYNLEEVANIMRPDDFSFDVYPKNPNNLQEMINGIFDAHPEFKMPFIIKNHSGQQMCDRLDRLVKMLKRGGHQFITYTEFVRMKSEE